MKKMTAKEFKEALNKAGFEMNIFGYESILNTLIMKLYDILTARGYYND